jgi:hypothetical protein
MKTVKIHEYRYTIFTANLICSVFYVKSTKYIHRVFLRYLEVLLK